MTLVDKANDLETSRLWREEVTRIAGQYPDVMLDYLFVDNAAMHIIQEPQSFDVILMEKMFGDILSDLASVITGRIRRQKVWTSRIQMRLFWLSRCCLRIFEYTRRLK
nr:3-isopropylmalate dehydrogenase [uncultured bacterium]